MSDQERDLMRYAVVNNEGEIYEIGLNSTNAAIYIESFNESMRGTGRELYALPVRCFIGKNPVPPTGPFFVPGFVREGAEQC